MNVCGACGRDFASVSSFDAHRVGRHRYTYSEGLEHDPPRNDGRRCLNDAEIADLFVVDGRGRLTLASQVGKAAGYFGRRTETSRGSS